MAVENARVAVAANARAALNVVGDIGLTLRIHVRNDDGLADGFIGGANVDANNGFRLPAGQAREFVLRGDEVLYAAAGTAGITLHVVRSRVE